MPLFEVPTLLSLFYFLSSALILLVYTVPQLHRRFLAYGARECPRIQSATVDMKDGRQPNKGMEKASELLDFLASIRVPHTWFLHFYVISIASSMLWLHQILTRGSLFGLILIYSPATMPSMTPSQIALCWTLMMFQGSRRLYECITLFKPSRSTMWIGHYTIGIAFYIATNISIWIQGLATIQTTPDIIKKIDFTDLGHATFLIAPLFLAASYIQHDVHVYLASLKKYTLPTRGAFSFLVAPHYTAECVIYLSIAAVAAPPSHVLSLNRSLCWAFLFVVVNLGVSAEMTRAWTLEKFGRDNVERKWRMVPTVW